MPFLFYIPTAISERFGYWKVKLWGLIGVICFDFLTTLATRERFGSRKLNIDIKFRKLPLCARGDAIYR